MWDNYNLILCICTRDYNLYLVWIISIARYKLHVADVKLMRNLVMHYRYAFCAQFQVH